MTELRKDPIIQRWVIISFNQGTLIEDAEVKRLFPFEDKKEKCPFCPGHEYENPHNIYIIKKDEGNPDPSNWLLRVIPDKFPILTIEGKIDRNAEGIYDRMDAIGANEIVIETPEHNNNWASMETIQLERIINTYRLRSLDLRKDRRIRHFMVLKNHGSPSSAYIHPHSNIVAMPIIPKRVEEELLGSKHYFDYKERCVYCDIIKQEKISEKRVVFQTKEFIVLTPFASRFPYEIWIIPKGHLSDFAKIPESHIPDLASCLKRISYLVKTTLNDPSYIMYLHSGPVQEYENPEYPWEDSHKDNYHWHIEIIPRLIRTAGFEWGSGFYINPVSPEDVAHNLRTAIPII